MRVAITLTVVSLLCLPMINACSKSEDTESETPTDVGNEPAAIPTIVTNTKGVVNYRCHWPSETPYTAIIKYDNRSMYCSQPTCKMSSKDVVGTIPAGTKVVNQGGTELVKVKVENGNHTGSIGYLSPECVDWGSDGTALTGAQVIQKVAVETGTLAERKAYAKQVDQGNDEFHHYTEYHGKVTVDGPDGTTMQYYDPDSSATAVSKDTEFIAELRKRGFRKLVFKDGTGTWDVDLSKDPAVPIER